MILAADSRDFVLFGPPHMTAMMATLLVSVALVLLMRSMRFSEKAKRIICVFLGLSIMAAVAADPVLTWLRYGHHPDAALELIKENSLPFYLCDVVSIILGLALIFRNRRLVEIGYLWGLAGTVQGLITPTLYFSWDTIEYYAFFIQHGGVPIAALTLVFGLKLYPEKGAFKRAVIWSWCYMLGAYLFNVALNTNYGFINEKPGVGTMFDHMGPWPWYLITLQVIAFSAYWILLIPFWKRNRELEGVNDGAASLAETLDEDGD